MKKYPSLKTAIRELAVELEENPTCGTPLGQQCYKIRLAIASKEKGKSGGARVITYYISEESVLFLLSIYDKSARNTITNDELAALLDAVW
jgi:hypothetical protein